MFTPKLSSTDWSAARWSEGEAARGAAILVVSAPFRREAAEAHKASRPKNLSSWAGAGILRRTLPEGL
jgi:hypothetical protein